MKVPTLYQLQVRQVHCIELDKLTIHTDCADQVSVGFSQHSSIQNLEYFERRVELIDDAYLHSGSHCFQKFTFLFLVPQPVMYTNIFECQESTFLLVKVDVGAVYY